jgi:nicotinamide-nucleotide amidase
MFREHVAPRLARFSSGVVYEVKKLWVAGLPESSVEQKIVSTYGSLKNPSTTILASAGQVEIRLTATGETTEACAATNERLASSLREILGDAIFSEKEEELEEVVGSLLAASGKRITVAESLTGGLIAERITDVSGSSRYFDQSFVTYSNEAKSHLLGVPAELFERVGAVSEEVAHSMATGARERSEADIAVAVTGIAGPSGGSDSKPVGLVYIALATDEGVQVERFQFPGARRQVKRWTSQAALNMARLALLQ